MPPTFDQIGEALGLNSRSTIHGHMQRLEALGKVRATNRGYMPV